MQTPRKVEATPSPEAAEVKEDLTRWSHLRSFSEGEKYNSSLSADVLIFSMDGKSFASQPGATAGDQRKGVKRTDRIDQDLT